MTTGPTGAGCDPSRKGPSMRGIDNPDWWNAVGLCWELAMYVRGMRRCTRAYY